MARAYFRCKRWPGILFVCILASPVCGGLAPLDMVRRAHAPLQPCKEKCWASISQLTGRAPSLRTTLDPLDQRLASVTGKFRSLEDRSYRTNLRTFDEVTVRFTTGTDFIVIGLDLQLPLQIICPDDTACGYDFSTNKFCGLVDSIFVDGGNDYVDLVNASLIKDCNVEHTQGNRRGVLHMYFDEQFPVGRGVEFTIVLLNPPYSPIGSDPEGTPWNSFILTLRGENDKISPDSKRGRIALTAREIMPVWRCTYSNFQAQSLCTAACGGGERYFVRTLVNPPPERYDTGLLEGCDQKLTKVEPCNEDPCIVDCRLGDWTDADESCSKSCGGGVKLERRRVLSAAASGGAPCVPWGKPTRQRVVACNIEPCPSESLEAVDKKFEDVCTNFKDESELRVTSPCSSFCGKAGEGGGPRRFVSTFIRHKYSLGNCNPWEEEECSLAPCADLQFFANFPGMTAVRGAWFDIIIGIRIPEPADILTILSPTGFDFDRGYDGDCRLVSHSFPRVENCTVSTEENRSNMTFSFLNPLEPRPVLSHELRFWVKHPEECNAAAPNYGVCKQPLDWVLTYHSYRPSHRTGSITGGYAIFVSAARGRDETATEDVMSQAFVPGNQVEATPDGMVKVIEGTLPKSTEALSYGGKWVWVPDGESRPDE